MADSMRCRTLLHIAALVALLAACASTPRGPYADPETIDFPAALSVNLAEATRLRNGMFVQDVREGDGVLARSDSRVRLHYALYMANDTPVQTTRGSDPLEVRLDNQEFMIRDAVAGMRAGGRRTIVVPPERGYGRDGVVGLIPPNMTLVFEVELLEILS
jgi:FKBP-type peptidyl-prolyl cis-trans isomerase FkpA